MGCTVPPSLARLDARGGVTRGTSSSEMAGDAPDLLQSLHFSPPLIYKANLIPCQSSSVFLSPPLFLLK